MFSKNSKLRVIGACVALATLALAASCTGFFVNPTITSLAIGPSNLSLAPSQSYQMVATATYSDGSTGNVTGKALWTSSDTSVANFSAPGLLQAGTLQALGATLPGTTTVSASDGSVSSSTQTVNVCPVVESLALTVNGSTSSATVQAPAQPQFIVEATFNGVTGTTPVTGSVTWNISNDSIVSISTTGLGTTTSGQDGTTTVSATLCGFTSPSVSLTVQD